jgi:hypothetical protein
VAYLDDCYGLRYKVDLVQAGLAYRVKGALACPRWTSAT